MNSFLVLPVVVGKIKTDELQLTSPTNKIKESSLCHKLNFLISISVQPDGFATFIFQTQIICSYRIESLKYLRSARLGCKDIGIRKSDL